MLPVNIAHGHEATVLPFSVAVRRQAIASTVYSFTGTETGYPLTTLLFLRPTQKTGSPPITNDSFIRQILINDYIHKQFSIAYNQTY